MLLIDSVIHLNKWKNVTKITFYEKIRFVLFILILTLQYITYCIYGLQRFYFENSRPVFDLMVLWSKGLSQ